MRYPFAPIDAHRGDVTLVELARRVGVARRTVHRWQADGLSEVNADRCAAAIGRVAYELWPEMIDHAIAETVRLCATCDAPLFGSPRKVYCNRSCQARHPANRAKASAYEREWKRRKYESDEQWRSKVLARNQEYRAAAERALKVKQKAYREANAERIKARASQRYWSDPERFRAEQRERDKRKRAA